METLGSLATSEALFVGDSDRAVYPNEASTTQPFNSRQFGGRWSTVVGRSGQPLSADNPRFHYAISSHSIQSNPVQFNTLVEEANACRLGLKAP